ncbi:MAG: prepilin-type N-terminal cleavage/methylation domain-containing protein, partial [Candidatus Staskawiczbacteria bacterium]
MQKSKSGFTIIELIVVIAIIAILAAIVMVNVTQYINKSKDASVKVTMNEYVKKIIITIADTGEA